MFVSSFVYLVVILPYSIDSLVLTGRFGGNGGMQFAHRGRVSATSRCRLAVNIQEQADSVELDAQRVDEDTCMFSMGCFWAPQKTFSAIDGVTKTMVGYTGGKNPYPTYSSVCGGDGHIETVRVSYDPKIVTYDQLLDVFWSQSENDFLSQQPQPGYVQYQSVLWTRGDMQKEAVRRRLAELSATGDGRIKLTTVKDSEPFYPAETYHDNYLQKQGPRNLLLVVSVFGTVLPQMLTSLLPTVDVNSGNSGVASVASTLLVHTPQWLNNLPAACSVLYLLIYALERVFDTRPTTPLQ